MPEVIDYHEVIKDFELNYYKDSLPLLLSQSEPSKESQNAYMIFRERCKRKNFKKDEVTSLLATLKANPCSAADILTVDLLWHGLIEGDPKQAEAYYKEIATRDDFAYFALGALEWERRNSVAAKQYCQKIYKKYLCAQSLLAEIHANGAELGDKKAAEYHLAETQQLAHTTELLGELSEIENQHDQAFALFQKAARGGNVLSLYQLGVCYFKSNGVKKDYDKALEYFKACEKAGFPVQEVLGKTFYQLGAYPEALGYLCTEYLKLEDGHIFYQIIDTLSRSALREKYKEFIQSIPNSDAEGYFHRQIKQEVVTILRIIDSSLRYKGTPKPASFMVRYYTAFINIRINNNDLLFIKLLKENPKKMLKLWQAEENVTRKREWKEAVDHILIKIADDKAQNFVMRMLSGRTLMAERDIPAWVVAQLVLRMVKMILSQAIPKDWYTKDFSFKETLLPERNNKIVKYLNAVLLDENWCRDASHKLTYKQFESMQALYTYCSGKPPMDISVKPAQSQQEIVLEVEADLPVVHHTESHPPALYPQLEQSAIQPPLVYSYNHLSSIPPEQPLNWPAVPSQELEEENTQKIQVLVKRAMVSGK